MARRFPDRYAFWEYDQFPFVLSGKIVQTDREGRVEVEGYDGMRFTPLRIVGGERGRQLSEELAHIKKAYREAKKTVDGAFRARALEAAPWLKECQRSSFYRKRKGRG